MAVQENHRSLSPTQSIASGNIAFALFSVLWAISVIVHAQMRNHWARTPSEFVLMILAFATILQPRSLPLFLALLFAQALNIFDQLPYLATHLILSLFVCMTVLAAWALEVIRRRTGAIKPYQLFAGFAPILRLLILILYFWVTFHKLNSDFFNPQVSCATVRYLHLTEVQLPFLPTGIWARYLVIYLTIGLELLIPILLILPRKRLWGIMLAAILHIGFAFREHVSFTSVMFALLSLYLPLNFPDLFRDWKERWSSRLRWLPFSSSITRWIRSPFFLTLSVLLAVVGIPLLTRNEWSGLTPPQDRYGNWTGPILYFWIAYQILLLILFVAFFFKPRKAILPRISEILTPLNPLLWVIPVVFFLNGLNPYIGLNTENSYAVFSNLRTELHRSNHLLVRKTAYLSSCQTDYVKVMETSRELPKRIALQKMVSQCELRNTIAEMAKKVKSGEVLRIRYLKNEEEVVVENAYADPYFSRPYPYLVRKLMRFKPVDEDAESLCKH